MLAFATVDDLAARWRPLTSAEEETARVLLEDASAMVRANCADIDSRLTADPPRLDADVPRIIVCAMVKRSMIGGADAGPGVGSVQDTAGPFSRSVSYSNPMGDLYLSKQERRMLGCGRQRASTINLMPNPDRMRGSAEQDVFL